MGNSKHIRTAMLLAVLFVSSFMIVVQGVARVYAQGPAVIALTNWPGLFTGRTVLELIGSGTPHGPYNDYAKVDDTVALVDVVGASGYSPGAGSGSGFDQNVITETGPPWSRAWRAGATTQDFIGVGGPVVSSLNRMYNSIATVPCAWDPADWSILCKDNTRYSDALGRHGYIAVFTDGTRRGLIVSGYSAYVTRGLGVILRNYAAYGPALQGQGVVLRLVDTDGDGIWEQGESYEILKIVKLASLGIDPTWSPNILGAAGFGWQPGSVLTYGPYRKLDTITNTGSLTVFNLRAFTYSGTQTTPQWATADGATQQAAGWRSPWIQTQLAPAQSITRDFVTGIPTDRAMLGAERWIRANTDDTGGVRGLERKTVYNIDGAMVVSYQALPLQSIRTAMTYISTAGGIHSLFYDQDVAPADGRLDLTGLGVPVGAAGLVGTLSEQTFNAALFGALDNDNLAVFVDDPVPGTYSLIYVDTDNDGFITDEVPINLAAAEPDNSIAFFTGLTGLVWFLGVFQVGAAPGAGDYGILVFTLANDISALPPAAPGPIVLPTGLTIPFNVDVEPVTAAAAAWSFSGVIGGALRTAGDPMAGYNYYVGSEVLVDCGPDALRGTADDTFNRFYHIVTIDPLVAGKFPMAFAGGTPWTYDAVYADLDGDGLFEAVGSVSGGEAVEALALRLAGPYGTEAGYPALVLIAILGDNLVYGLTGAANTRTKHQWQLVRVSEGGNFIAQGGNAGDDIFGTNTVTTPNPVGQVLYALGNGLDNTPGTADDINFPSLSVATDANDIFPIPGSGDLQDPLTPSCVYPLDLVIYAKTIRENPTGVVGDEVDWNQDADTLDTFYALVVPRLSEAAYGAGGTNMNGDVDTVDFVDSVMVDDPTVAPWPGAPSWTDDLLGFAGVSNQLATGYQADNAIHITAAAWFELFYINYQFGADGLAGTFDDSAGFGVIGNTSPVAPGLFTINTPGSVDNFAATPSPTGAIDVSFVSAPLAGLGVQNGRSVFTNIWGLVSSGLPGAYTGGFSAGMLAVDDTPPTITSPVIAWTYFTGAIFDDVDTFPLGGVPATISLAFVLRDSTTDGTFDTVVLNNDNDASVVDPGTPFGGQDAVLGTAYAGNVGTGVLQIYQIISSGLAAYQTSAGVPPAGAWGEGSLTIGGTNKLEQLINPALPGQCLGGVGPNDLNQDADIRDVWVLFANLSPILGNHISERYEASGLAAGLAFAAAGPLDSPTINAAPAAPGVNPNFVVSLFARGWLNEDLTANGPTADDMDINNDGDRTDIFDWITKVRPGTQNNVALFPNADLFNRAVIDTDDNNRLADNVQLAEGAFVTFGVGPSGALPRGWVWIIPGPWVTYPGISEGPPTGGIDISPDGGAGDWDLVLAIPSTATLQAAGVMRWGDDPLGVAGTFNDVPSMVNPGSLVDEVILDVNTNGVYDPGVDIVLFEGSTPGIQAAAFAPVPTANYMTVIVVEGLVDLNGNLVLDVPGEDDGDGIPEPTDAGYIFTGWLVAVTWTHPVAGI